MHDAIPYTHRQEFPPDDGPALNGSGQILFDKKAPAVGVEHLQRSLVIPHINPSAMNHRGGVTSAGQVSPPQNRAVTHVDFP